MKRESSGPVLSAVFVDYDNIYLSLKRKSEEAAKRFAKDAGLWLREIDTGRLITPTNGLFGETRRRLVMNRCYGNPVPRRNSTDNSTDMNSFPFVRHHFLRAGFEIIDCPPLTAQLKNSSDIRMVMDVRDFLTHETYFDEFIILSGDADFTPVLHRLRAHARRTVIFANDYTASPYTAICDGEIRESDLIRLLLDGKISAEPAPFVQPAITSSADLDRLRHEIVAEVVAQVRQSAQPVPLEALAERATRVLGHERTVALNWAGAGSFRELLVQGLPDEIQLTDEPPYLAFVVVPKAVVPATPEPRMAAPQAQLTSRPSPPQQSNPAPARASAQPPTAPRAERAIVAPLPAPTPAAQQTPKQRAPLLDTQPSYRVEAVAQPQVASPAQRPAAQQSNTAQGLQQSISRIHDACQAPPLSPPEYRSLFEAMAQEITEAGLQGSQTIANIQARAQQKNFQLQRDDVRFVLDVVGESDPWFEQGANASLFASRFRNFVVARCRSQGLSLSVDELDLIEAWFAGGPPPTAQPVSRAPRPVAGSNEAAIAQRAPAPPSVQQNSAGVETWWASEPQRAPAGYAGNSRQPAQAAAEPPALVAAGGETDEFPRIVRTRLRG